MYTDIDSSGKITIAELTEKEAEAIQIAALAIAENQAAATEQSHFLRRLAIHLDSLLPKSPVVIEKDNYQSAHIFNRRNKIN